MCLGAFFGGKFYVEHGDVEVSELPALKPLRKIRERSRYAIFIAGWVGIFGDEAVTYADKDGACLSGHGRPAGIPTVEVVDDGEWFAIGWLFTGWLWGALGGSGWVE